MTQVISSLEPPGSIYLQSLAVRFDFSVACFADNIFYFEAGRSLLFQSPIPRQICSLIKLSFHQDLFRLPLSNVYDFLLAVQILDFETTLLINMYGKVASFKSIS